MEVSVPRGANADGRLPFTVHTDVFDGPLDLLLHLVKRDGISLARLSVSRIADAYLVYLDQMRALDLSIAADWLVMAATLVHLKSLELLPRPPAILEAADEPDPRDQLLEQLREYEAIREAAGKLDERPQLGRDVFARLPEKGPEGDRPVVSPVDAFGLLDVLYEVLERGAKADALLRLGDSGPNIASCCFRVLGALGGKGGVVELAPLISLIETMPERVVTFVAVLEMARLGWLDVRQAVHRGPVWVEQVAEDADIDVVKVIGAEPAEQQLALPLGRPT